MLASELDRPNLFYCFARLCTVLVARLCQFLNELGRERRRKMSDASFRWQFSTCHQHHWRSSPRPRRSQKVKSKECFGLWKGQRRNSKLKIKIWNIEKQSQSLSLFSLRSYLLRFQSLKTQDLPRRRSHATGQRLHCSCEGLASWRCVLVSMV